MFETIYEIDIRSRKDGNSVECIYSGDDYCKACEIADRWNKEHVADYEEGRGWEEYLDYTEGFFADIIKCDSKEEVHGVGKF